MIGDELGMKGLGDTSFFAVLGKTTGFWELGFGWVLFTKSFFGLSALSCH